MQEVFQLYGRLKEKSEQINQLQQMLTEKGHEGVTKPHPPAPQAHNDLTMLRLKENVAP